MTFKRAQILAVGACALLLACGRQPPLKYWQTNENPTDKPAVNYVVSQNASGEMDLTKVLLRSETPSDGRIRDQEMGFIVSRRTKERIIFELRDVPGAVAGISFPPDLGKTFEAKVTSGPRQIQEVRVFRELRK